MNLTDLTLWGTVAAWSGAAVTLFSTWLERHNREEAHFELQYHEHITPYNGNPIHSVPFIANRTYVNGFHVINNRDGDFHHLSASLHNCNGCVTIQGNEAWASVTDAPGLTSDEDIWVFIDDLYDLGDAYLEFHWIASPTRLMKCRYQQVRLAAEPYPWTWVGRSAYRVRQWWYHRCWHRKQRRIDRKNRQEPIQQATPLNYASMQLHLRPGNEPNK